ncbi:MAG: hypothetical protein AAFX93_14015 [Verrucomicrobiota bacterium]
MNEKDQPNPHSAFMRFMAAHQNGALALDVSEKMQECTKALVENGKKGGKAKVTIEIVFEKIGPEQILIGHEPLKVKKPVPKRDASMFFTNEEGELARKPFNQDEFGFADEQDAEQVKRIEASGS